MEPITVQHTFPPIFDKNSRLLILGTCLLYTSPSPRD